VDQAKSELRDRELDASQVKHVDYNLAKAHSDAQILDLEGASLQERESFANRIWKEYLRAKDNGVSDTIIDHLDVVSAFDLEHG